MFKQTQKLSAWPRTRSIGTRVLFDADSFFLLLCIVAITGFLWVETGRAADVADSTVQLTEGSLAQVEAGTFLFTLNERVGTFAAPLVTTDINTTVTGMIADVTVTQRFFNPTEFWIEGLYAFPLPQDAAIYALRLEVGERVIEGQIKEKAQAQKVFEQAKQNGQKAGLLVQTRPNLFTTTVANVAAGETVVVRISYQQSLVLQTLTTDPVYELRIPTAITPRYDPNTLAVAVLPVGGEPEALLQSNRTAGNADSTPSTVEPSQLLIGEPNQLRVNVTLIPGYAVENIHSPSHEILVAGPQHNRYSVSLAGVHRADRDYLLLWQPAPGRDTQASVISETIGNDSFHLITLLPPRETIGGHPLPREVIFVLDVSGSMYGQSIAQAKQALLMAIDRLRSQDKFNLVQFSDEAKSLFKHPVDASRENVLLALSHVNKLVTEGGTEMEAALHQVFSMPISEGYLAQVVFLTDGAVSNETALFKLIGDGLGERRLFTVGIGSAPNSYFMVKAAQFGRGAYTYIADEKEVQEKMSNLFQRIENPAISDILVQGQNSLPIEIWPHRLPDLYLGQPLTVLVKTPANTEGAIDIRGSIEQTQWHPLVDFSKAPTGVGIGRLWARQKIDELMDSIVAGSDEMSVRQDVLSLALSYRLMSKYTSFVAVDVSPQRAVADELKRVRYANERPAGSAPAAILPLANTATSASINIRVGGLLLMFCGLYSASVVHQNYRNIP